MNESSALEPRRYALFLEGHSVALEIGFLEREIGRLQEVLVDIAVEIDTACFPDDDVVASVWNYDLLRRVIDEAAQSRRFNLQESFARRIFGRLSAMKQVLYVSVTTRKPEAYPNARAVGITLSSR